MNLEDVLNEKGLQQDEWSLSKPTFGKEGQLEVVGHDGNKGNKKYYILKCTICSQDKELFGAGYFKATKASITRGCLPCGCSPAPRLSKEGLEILIKRNLREGIKFVGLASNFRGSNTKVLLNCDLHGQWEAFAANVISNKAGCFSCSMSKHYRLIRPSEEEQTKLLISSGNFAHGTTFTETTKPQTTDKTVYYSVTCGECGTTYESRITHLKNGHKGCLCSRGGQIYAYIMNVSDRSSDEIIAIKFGISRGKLSQRTWDINKSSKDLKVSLIEVWKFPTTKDCRNAELMCTQKLNAVITRGRLNGFSETASIEDISKVRQIYEIHGGVIEIDRKA